MRTAVGVGLMLNSLQMALLYACANDPGADDRMEKAMGEQFSALVELGYVIEDKAVPPSGPGFVLTDAGKQFLTSNKES